jgi:primosomal protein N' (replication factor Y) (superfamily II helicase)
VKLAHVALDVPLEEAFDFLIPEGQLAPIGSLVVVPFGRTRRVGVVVGLAEGSRVPVERLKSIESVVADIPPIASAELELYDFCARYYQRPLGEVLGTVLPPRLRQVSRRPLGAPAEAGGAAPRLVEAQPLTQEQREAIALCATGSDAFQAVLLHGVTGSGKTEVYLHLIARALAAGRQALFLVPEIGLTPQFETQVRQRFPDANLVAAHSHLGEGERAATWLAAQSGAAHIVLGTRLAVLMPFRRLGLIVVDEEHDLSYKQQEGLRYSARDIAVRRAQRLGIPVILGSATPSLETFANARDGRYVLASLTRRASSGSAMPVVRTVDTRADRPHEGFSHALVEAIRGRLAKKEQSLIFVNRRGFSPVLFCRACAWHSTCKRCSANLVVHLGAREMRCHHCGHRSRIPAVCPDCGAADLAPIGHGTQRVEDTLVALFPHARIARVDRDSTSRKGSLRGLLEKVRKGEIDILVGTQMLAKGHDYPKLTLVGVLDCDSALFSADFRASERLFSQLVQVSGRAGRGEAPGEVLIQTDFPGHPLFAAVARQDYARFAEDALAERRLAGFPPFSHLALLRAESRKAGEATIFLKLAARLAKRLASRPEGKDIEVFDPVPAPLERKAGYERAQLLVRAASRATLQPFLHEWRLQLADKGGRHIRWSLDVDPQEV